MSQKTLSVLVILILVASVVTLYMVFQTRAEVGVFSSDAFSPTGDTRVGTSDYTDGDDDGYTDGDDDGYTQIYTSGENQCNEKMSYLKGYADGWDACGGDIPAYDPEDPTTHSLGCTVIYDKDDCFETNQSCENGGKKYVCFACGSVEGLCVGDV
jgi:hypothetical protein